MCSIIGYINYEDSIKKTLSSMKILKNRGNDNYGIYFEKYIFYNKNLNKISEKVKNKKSNICLGHNLHSIVNFVKQPIKKNGILISNCEIYNWKELKNKYNLNSKNDSELILDLIEIIGIKKLISVIEGPFAFCYYNKNKITLTRDIIGEKPLFYSYNKNQFCFASEKKALNENNIKELNPREILEYNINTNELNFIENKLSFPNNELKKNYSEIKKETYTLLKKSIKKMIPQNQKIGLLFSGGIDSTFIAIMLKNLNIDFTCYTAKLEGGNIKEASDYLYAKEIAKKYNLKLKIAKINVDKLEPYVKKIISLIEDNEYIKVSVALPFYLACEKAKKDNVKVMFSGLGAEELFAGYRRHKKVKTNKINQECYNGLLTLHKRDLYRDDVICMDNNQELRLPFLDKNLIEYSLKIPAKYKLNIEKNRSKIILRNISKEIGINEKYSERQKKAAQYGSKFDKGLLRLAKNKKIGKQEYLNSL